MASGNYLNAGEPVVLLGDSGTGKTHLLTGLGLAGCEQGRKVRYVTCAQLVNELVEAADERVLSRVVARYGRPDLLLLDELVNQDQIDSAVAVDQLAELFVVGSLDQFVDQLAGQGAADALAGLGGQGAQRDQQMAFAGARVTDQTQWVSGLDPGAAGQLTDDRRVDGRVSLKRELLQPFWPGKPSLADAAPGAPGGCDSPTR
ncbi:hypothetical protein M2432_003741 [Mycobacterium sp. OTB74]|nr:hypothetical protein [Mycobacterium sp. OTB74]